MSDWATRMREKDDSFQELQPKPVAVDIDETIMAIRRIVRAQEERLPDDILAAEARRRVRDKVADSPVTLANRPRFLAALMSRWI